jgi:hypothetical protein
MRGLGLLAAGFVVFAVAGAWLGLAGEEAAAAPPAPAAQTPATKAPAPQPAAVQTVAAKVGSKAPLPHNVALTLIMSRGHEVLTVVVQNNGPGEICIDPNFTAPVRLSAFDKSGKPIASMNAQPGKSKAECIVLAPRKSLHAGFDLRPVYPLGLPGEARLCYGVWWHQGGPAAHSQEMRSARCRVLPAHGLGRR